MPRAVIVAIVFIGVVLFALSNVLFVVRQDQQAIMRRLGEFHSSMNVTKFDGTPGLYAKLPFADTVVVFDKRNLGLTLQEQAIVAADQERLIVDAMVRWRIVDPLRFYQAVQTEEGGAQRLHTRAESALRRTLGNATSNEIISGRRSELMQDIEDDLNRSARTDLGVEIVDVRIRQADLPSQTEERVYQNMRSEREQEAARIRAEGEERAIEIRADADRQAVVLIAQAREQSERLRGEGDGERARIFANAYGRNAEFANFYRSMRAYETALQEGTPIVIPPDSDFFRYMQDRRGRQ